MMKHEHDRTIRQHSTQTKALVILPVLLLLSSCGDKASDPEKMQSPLRPGVEDSSRAFKGTPSPAENMFWEAIRNGDDAARQQAVAQLKLDVAKDSSNGYSAFLAAADAFMPLSALLRAAVNQATPPQSRPFPDDTGPLLGQGLQHLTDPLYLGFDATLLAGLQAFTDPASAPKTQAIAIANNIPASSVGQLNTALRMSDWAGARDVMLGVLDYCTGSALDRTNPDVNGYVERANAGSLAHRECYSGYHAMHGTEGVIMITGDLIALNGNADLAKRFYQATRSASNYSSWPLKPLMERRISDESPATKAAFSEIAACSTCHIYELK